MVEDNSSSEDADSTQALPSLQDIRQSRQINHQGMNIESPVPHEDLAKEELSFILNRNMGKITRVLLKFLIFLGRVN